ncbi:hypothetical protein [Alicyclobacillus fastidiosus]|uniref:Copper amine oxidase-like N-terminal domain-containing protein n=1 Tax=Alicyclobacillus fastidiosus TaxID=392011 RepID=A0ABV5A9W2_9BACL|nr:hypothetical protein [Alicyclobacillus fastidiosus]WEH10979.1 hypothetical protein PYS47_07115 [Alicyclobacillus fastidiosus]
MKTSSTVSPNTSSGNGTMGIYVNGKLIQEANGIAAVDPNSKKTTTYMPIWYVQHLMSSLNLFQSWDGDVV